MSDKPYTLTDLRQMIRSRKSWPKFAPQLAQAQQQNQALGILQRDMAFSHFLGGCQAKLMECGHVNRAEFVRLLQSATEFGKHCKF